MPLSEHVYCVAIAFKVAEQVEQQDCIQFCVKLEHSSMECIWVIQRPQLWVTGDWQFHHDNAPARASRLVQSFLAKHQIAQVTQPPYSPDLSPCDFWILPKLQSPLKGKRFKKMKRLCSG